MSLKRSDVSIAVICSLIISFIIFTYVTYSASAAHEVDKTAKISNIKVVSML